MPLTHTPVPRPPCRTQSSPVEVSLDSSPSAVFSDRHISDPHSPAKINRILGSIGFSTTRIMQQASIQFNFTRNYMEFVLINHKSLQYYSKEFGNRFMTISF